MSILSSEIVRTGIISTAMAVAGYAGHVILTVNNQTDILTAHTGQIRHLMDGQDDMQKSLGSLSTGLVRLEGKVDTVNQKIDDDRAAKHR